MSNVYGGYAQGSGDVTGNAVHLVGNGAVATICGTAYEGNALSNLRDVYGGSTYRGTVRGNSIDIYGSGIQAYSLQGWTA